MPAPMNGLALPAASPMTSHVGPGGRTDRATQRDPAAGRSAERRAGLDLPALGDVGRELLEQVCGVDRLEVLGGRHDARADVDSSVAEREHPPVAGDRRAVAVGEIDRRARSSVCRGTGTRSSCGSPWRRATCVRATCRGRARSGCWPRRRPRGSGPASRSSNRRVGGRRRRGRSRGRRSERSPRGRRGGSHRPRRRDRRRARRAGRAGRRGRTSGTPDAMASRSRRGCSRPARRIRSMRWNSASASVGDSHRGELVDRTRCEGVAARLHAGHRAPFEDDDAMAGGGEPDGRRGTSGPGADDDGVDGIGCRVGPRAPPLPEPGSGAVTRCRLENRRPARCRSE